MIMRFSDDDDVTLWLLRDGREPEMWLDIWAKSYPLVRCWTCSPDEPLMAAQQRLVQAWRETSPNPMAVVAHGLAANVAALAYAHCPLAWQQKIAAMILVAPMQAASVVGGQSLFSQVRFACKAAWVSSADDKHCPHDWAQQQAQQCAARWFAPPETGHLNHADSWQWGAQLLQEMLI